MDSDYMNNDEERLCKTLDALYEVHGIGLEETAQFLASELGVKPFFIPEKLNG